MKGKTIFLPAMAAYLLSGCAAAYTCRNADSRPTQFSITFTDKDQSHIKKAHPGHPIGPVEENLPQAQIPKEAEFTTDTLVVEKGGRRTYVPPYIATLKPEAGLDKYPAAELMKKADSLKAYAAQNGYHTGMGILINMGMKSGKRRFFIVDLNTHRIISSGIVAHGRGTENFTYDRQFSNDLKSNCSSLGIYKIGKSYTGSFGLSYRLYGLESTNNNALKRYVVLHAMNCIPDKESEFPICQTEGCPAVSPSYLKQISPLLNQAYKPLLMWIYR